MLINGIPPIVDEDTAGVFKVDGETLDIDENGKLIKFSIPYEPILDDNTWEQISNASSEGIAKDLQAVGDCKKITLNGNVGEGLTFTNYETYVYILGFDHNAELEGYGISFGGFKTAQTNGVDVALCDNSYGTNAGYTGAKKFAMNHWGSNSNPYNTNYGGWKGCDLRYDILGSTDSAPSGYGSMPQTNRTGVDASSTTATSPVANTLMAALPSDLRAVMKPITKYTDNKGNSSNYQENVTASIDYLPLLAEYEVQGGWFYANQFEQSSQAQYTYYINGNSKIKYNHSSTSSAVYWWCRSARYSNAYALCRVNTDGSANANYSSFSLGLVVAFLV